MQLGEFLRSGLWELDPEVRIHVFQGEAGEDVGECDRERVVPNKRIVLAPGLSLFPWDFP